MFSLWWWLDWLLMMDTDAPGLRHIHHNVDVFVMMTIRLVVARVRICEENWSTKRSLCLDLAHAGISEQNWIETNWFVWLLLGYGFVKKIDQLRDHFVCISLGQGLINNIWSKLIYSFWYCSGSDLWRKSINQEINLSGPHSNRFDRNYPSF